MDDKFPAEKNVERYIVGLRFQRVGKIYHFDASNVLDLKPGDYAVVETSRGCQLGQMIYAVGERNQSMDGGLKPVLRQATAQDLIVKQSWEQKEADAVINCQRKVEELGFHDVKIIAAEFSIDGKRLYFSYSCEEGEKVDLKPLRRAMQRFYTQTHIELHLIGPRDVAKIMGGMGACGLEIRCCSAFLPDFSPISIKMAKEQGISLTPTEITGMCGRLRCCLEYEHEQYSEARKLLPKRGKRVGTPMGDGKVIEILALKSSVVVEVDAGGRHEFSAEEIVTLGEQEQARKKTDSSSDKQSAKVRQSSKKGKSRGNGYRT
jgi:cell fate regulator YaaT (PSP1 superfamily)